MEQVLLATLLLIKVKVKEVVLILELNSAPPRPLEKAPEARPALITPTAQHRVRQTPDSMARVHQSTRPKDLLQHPAV